MADQILYILDSKIKKLRIELPNYNFSHSLSEESTTKDNSDFVGRKKILEKLKSLVTDAKNKTGVYLVTGNRGVGKTSLVNKLINETKSNNRLDLRINFGHNLKDEKDILRLIARTLSTEYNKYCSSFRRMWLWRIISFVFLSVLACWFSLTIGKPLLEEYHISINIKGIDNLIPNFFWQSLLFSFSFMYLFFVLLISKFFVTHGLIMQQLKKLNSDITHSTERENSLNIKSESIGTDVGMKTKKSRNIADAREIEKELQDILENAQRIPNFMCRPKFVIVFDELDKIEQGETKASLFSVNATREKQSEILKILSNLKYFLSTANAKFIFIAGREMYDIYLADVSERSNYIGSIFNAVIYVPSFLTDYTDNVNSDMTSLTEEFVCRKLIPRKSSFKDYNLKNYREYLERNIFNGDHLKDQKIQKVIAVLQQLIIYLAHVSKGAPKKMIQLFESFIEIAEGGGRDNFLTVAQSNTKSNKYLTFDYYKQYVLGMTAYLITPIFNKLSTTNLGENSDKLLVSSLRFVDFLFKFHKHTFSWKNLEISPEIMEINRSPELKSVAIDLLNYLTQIHINNSNFSLNDYKFDSLIANEIFTMTKTDEIFSALYSFSLDETLPLKEHYKKLLKETQEKYENNTNSDKFIHSLASLQVVLGDLHYYDDELEEAEMYYESTIHTLRYKAQKNKENGNDETMTMEELYLFVRNMLKLGAVSEKRKQYDFAYLTYGELCKRIIWERDITDEELKKADEELAATPPQISPNTNDILFKKMTFDGLKLLYLPFIAKLQILEKSHVGGITLSHLDQLDREFKSLTFAIKNVETNFLEADFFSRVADILYYKNSNLRNLNKQEKIYSNYSCTACSYYWKALSTLLNNNGKIVDLLNESVKQIKWSYNIKKCTVLARILSNWGNVFYSCDKLKETDKCCFYSKKNGCNTPDVVEVDFEKYIQYVESEKDGLVVEKEGRTKMEIAFAMYAVSLKAYSKANLYKRSAYQIYKMLRLFNSYGHYNKNYIENLGQKAICFLWYTADELNIFELNKRKIDFDKKTIEEQMPLQYLLVDSQVSRIWTLVKELKLKMCKNQTPQNFSEMLRDYYKLHITSPYAINYSIPARIFQLRLKSTVNYEAYQKLLPNHLIEVYNKNFDENFKIKLVNMGAVFNEQENKFVKTSSEINIIMGTTYPDYIIKEIFGEEDKDKIFEGLIAESIFCLKEIIRLTKTIGETYMFNHSFMGSMHDKLSFWIRRYEAYKKNAKNSSIDDYLEYFLGKEWKEGLSGFYENQQALSHYYKCLETHNEGKAYRNMTDNMCYIKDDYNDRSEHFNIAEERHYIFNRNIGDQIMKKKKYYMDSDLYKVDNYCKNNQ